MGRVLSATQADPDGAGPRTAPFTSYTEDVDGQMLTLIDPVGRVTGNRTTISAVSCRSQSLTRTALARSRRR